MLIEPIELGEFQNGLTQLGKLEQNKWVTLDNCDVHSEIGIVKPQLKMSSESVLPDEPCVSAIDPNGNVYFFSTYTGKMWRRTVEGVYTQIGINGNGAHRGARYFNGYVWYWTQTKLGYYEIGGSFTDSFADGTDFREGIEANNTLLIANGRYIARVDASNSYSDQELVLPAMYKVTCLKNIGDDVLIGTYVSEEVAYCRVFLWDTVSTSWTYEDEVFEIGINNFIQLDNILAAQCGTNGRFYYWTGSKMNYFGKIRDAETSLGYQKTTTYNGRPLIAVGSNIYSIHKEENGLPYAFVDEYSTNGTIESLAVQGQDLLASVGTGVDKIDTDHAVAIIETPEIQTQVSEIRIKYDEYPEGIGVEINVNGAGYVTKTPRIDTTKREAWFDGNIVDGYTTQIKVTLTPSGSNVPKIKSIVFR